MGGQRPGKGKSVCKMLGGVRELGYYPGSNEELLEGLGQV